jgi:hypothetical protein
MGYSGLGETSAHPAAWDRALYGRQLSGDAEGHDPLPLYHDFSTPDSNSYRNRSTNDVIHKNQTNRQYQAVLGAGSGGRFGSFGRCSEAGGAGGIGLSVWIGLVRRAAERVMVRLSIVGSFGLKESALSTPTR